MSTSLTLPEELRARRDLPSPALRREIRKAAGVSQAAIAREVERITGERLTRRSVSTWEKDTRKPTGANLAAYVQVLRMLQGFGADEADS